VEDSLKLHIQRFGQLAGSAELWRDFGRAIHGQAVEAAGNGQLAALVERLEGLELPIDRNRILEPNHTDVDIHVRFGVDDIGPSTFRPREQGRTPSQLQARTFYLRCL
jgi:hypothetical protein